MTSSQPKPCSDSISMVDVLAQIEASKNVEYECLVCLERSRERFINGKRCWHDICTRCVYKYLRLEIVSGRRSIACPGYNCRHELDPEALLGQKKKLFVEWCDTLCWAAISEFDRVYCPDCDELIVNECGGTPRKYKCPRCRKLFCYQCKDDDGWHEGFGCDRAPNDDAFWRLVEEKKWMRCPGCRHFVENAGGCLSIRCRCGTDFRHKYQVRFYKDHDFWSACIFSIMVLVLVLQAYFR